MWILIDSVDSANYYAVKTELVQRGIEFVNPYLNVFAIEDTERNRRIATFLALRDGSAIEVAVGLDRVLSNYSTEHPKRVSKMA